MYLSKWNRFFLLNVIQLQRANFDFGQGPKKFSSSSSHRLENYYDTLGISRRATQSDIKSAYYKLSMQYHPDKNKGSEVAAKKFRDISEAYEVLGNFRLRKLYDKGIYSAGSHFAHDHQDEVVYEAEDAQTKFYKSRMSKSEVPPATGRTPIYDFDEWSRAHYGTSFERKKAAKARYDQQMERDRHHEMHIQKEMLILGIATCVLGFVVFTLSQSNLDVDKTRKNGKDK